MSHFIFALFSRFLTFSHVHVQHLPKGRCLVSWNSFGVPCSMYCASQQEVESILLFLQ